MLSEFGLLFRWLSPFSGRRLIRYSGGIDGKIEPKVAPRAEKTASWLGGIYGKNAVDYLLGCLFRVISKMNESSLHAALLENRLDLARSLIQQGADVNAPDDYGKTPLFLAAEFPEITELLLNAGTEVNIHDKEGETPLHEVAEDGTVIQCRMLLGHGANVNAEDRRKQTSLHVAAAYGQYEVAELLIEQGADVNHRDVNGKAPLHYAVHGNIMPHELDAHLKIAEALISAGADLQARTNNNETPLELAKQHFGYPELATLLVRHGAK